MATATVETALGTLVGDPTLLKASLDAVNRAFTMCNLTARCVGVSAVPAAERGLVTGMIGVHGKVSGFISVTMSERLAIRAVEGLLQEKFDGLSSQVVDGVGEIANIIVGGIKGALASTPWSFPHMTVPSVIVGQGYHISYAKGLEFLCTTFEHDDPEAFLLDDRLMQVSISLLRL